MRTDTVRPLCPSRESAIVLQSFSDAKRYNVRVGVQVKELETRLDEQVRQSGARVIKEGAKVREEMASKLRTLEAELAGMRAAKEDTAKEDALKAKVCQRV